MKEDRAFSLRVLILLIVALTASSYGLYQLSLLVRLNFLFRETRATVLNATVMEIQQFAEGDSGVRVKAFRPSITYQYEVDAQIFKNDRYPPVDEGASKEWAESIAKNYSPASEITVHYYQYDPAYSVVVKDVPQSTHEKIILACGGGLFCFVMAFYFFRNRHAQIVDPD